MPTRAELAAIVDVVASAGAILFSDEMYRFLEVGPLEEACPSAAQLYTRAVALGGLSKSHSCPGLRCACALCMREAVQISCLRGVRCALNSAPPARCAAPRSGWLVTRDPALRARLLVAKDYTTICGAGPSEALSLMALRAGDTIVARNRATMAANLALLNAFFARHAATWEWSPPRGGTVGFPRLRTGESADAFCARVLAGCNVLLLPSSVYDFVPDGEQRVRIGFGRRDMPAVLQRLGDFLMCVRARACARAATLTLPVTLRARAQRSPLLFVR